MNAVPAHRFRLFSSRLSKTIQRLSLLLLLVALVPASIPAYAANIIVDSSADGAPANDGACTLREAMINANADDQSGSTDCASGSGTDTITLPGAMTITLNGAQLPTVTTNINISGSGAAYTIIQANAAPNTATYRVFEVDGGGSLGLNSMIVRNGRCVTATPCATSGVNGGGIYNAGLLTLDFVIVSGNTATSGGGVYSSNALQGITNSVVSGNTTTGDGGGIYNSGTFAILDNTAISGNSAGPGSGAGLYNSGVIATISRSTFSANMASGSGGGIKNDTAATITTIANSTFSANNATGGGGGIKNLGTISTINNSTLISNQSGGSNTGGGINNTGGAITTVSNTIISGSNSIPGNCVGNVPGTSTADFTNVNGCFGWSNTNVLDGASYDSLRDNGCATRLAGGNCVKTHAVPFNSFSTSLRNAAVGGTAQDQRGYNPWGVRDVGAFELSDTIMYGWIGDLVAVAEVTRVNLTWSDISTPEASYKVERSLAGADIWTLVATAGSNAVSYTDTTATCNTAYDYRVRLSFADGDGTVSNLVSATTGACGPWVMVSQTFYDFGGVVTGQSSATLDVTLSNPGTNTLNFTMPSSPTDFNVDNGDCGSSLAPLASCEFHVTFTPTTPGSKDQWVTISSNAVAGANQLNVIGQGLIPRTPPLLSAPKNGSVVAKVPVKLTWKPSKSSLPATGYHIVLDDITDPNSPVNVADTDVTAPYYTTTALPFGVYRWKVNLTDATGTTGYTLPYTFDVTLLKTPKKNGTVPNGLVKFAWNAVKGSGGYRLQVYDDLDTCRNGGTITFQTETTKPAYSMKSPDAPLALGTYYWHVSSISGVTTPVTPCWRFDVTTLKSPKNGALVTNFVPKFTWAANPLAVDYRLNFYSVTNAGTASALFSGLTTLPAYTAQLSDGFTYGHYQWTIEEDITGFGPETPPFDFYITNMSKPLNNTFTTDTTPSFSWKKVTGETSYTLQISSNAGFSTPYSFPVGPLLKYTLLPAEALGQGVYYWRVVTESSGNYTMPAWVITVGP